MGMIEANNTLAIKSAEEWISPEYHGRAIAREGIIRLTDIKNIPKEDDLTHSNFIVVLF
jgi:hypothetical protein